MLLVSHEMSFVRNVATRVIFLDGGKILEDGTPREVFGNPKNERVKEFFTKINRIICTVKSYQCHIKTHIRFSQSVTK